MSRHSRRNGKSTKANLYEIGERVNVMERNVVAACIKPKFSAMDVARFLVPDKIIQTLTQARALLYAPDGSNAYENYPAEVVLGDYGLVTMSVYINCAKLDTQAWKHDLVELQLDTPAAMAIRDTMEIIYRICGTFDKVREVVQWFEYRKVKYGVVRYFWPSMGHFLSSDHPFHTAPVRDNDSIAGIGSIVPLLRETSATVLSGVLAPSHKPSKATIRIGPDRLRQFDVV